MHPDPQKVTHLAPAPLYMQIKESIRARILDGTYKAHEQMPSESEMIKEYGVSRTTVRQALGDLQKEGLLFKVHGKGTSVSRPKAFQELAWPVTQLAITLTTEDCSYLAQDREIF